jgi:uncharacterized protein (TIGR02646 family)
MRNITKSAGPPSLTAWRAQNPRNYEDYPDKDTLRDSLYAEQRGLCCYCQCRLHPAWNTMKIEHWKSREHNEDLRVVYSNLLGACLGGERKRGRDQHCDTFKGDKDLCRNPAEPSHDVEVLLSYLNDGTIVSSHAEFNQQLRTVLNMNHITLMNSRESVLDALKKALWKRGTLSRGEWERIISDWSGAGHNEELRPHCNVIIYWAQKHLAHL